MNSPVHPEVTMRPKTIEPGLDVFECPKSGGLWIPLLSYLAWKEKQPDKPAELPVGDTPVPQDDSKRRALICPESGRLLLRYGVGHGFQFHVEHSPATGGVWLDKGEWEALKSKGLHVGLHLIFTASYQRQIRSAEYNQTLNETFRDRIGAADFARVAEFGAWLASHPKRRDICCYLLDSIEQKNEPGVDSAEAPPATSR
jgi:Zn-finger nucleic acid-binding protein